MEPITRLENAIEAAEAMATQTIPVASTLVEIFRKASTGFTDSEATYWAERLEGLLAA